MFSVIADEIEQQRRVLLAKNIQPIVAELGPFEYSIFEIGLKQKLMCQRASLKDTPQFTQYRGLYIDRRQAPGIEVMEAPVATLYPDLDSYIYNARRKQREVMATKLWKPGLPFGDILAFDAASNVLYHCLLMSPDYFRCGKCQIASRFEAPKCEGCGCHIKVTLPHDFHEREKERFEEVIAGFYREAWSRNSRRAVGVNTT